MHPYHYGAQSGVAWGNQPIDQVGNPTFLGGTTEKLVWLRAAKVFLNENGEWEQERVESEIREDEIREVRKVKCVRWKAEDELVSEME